jgi:dihydroorotate dehydrogenase
MLYRSLLRPVLFRLPPETAHEMALTALSVALKPESVRKFVKQRYASNEFGKLERFGLQFKNPVGLAAGFDKNGEVVRELAALGFGFVEVGTVTHQSQPGNPQPRLFRLSIDRALINRQGFNNEGAAALAQRLSATARDGIIGINIGKSRAVDIDHATADYVESLRLIHPHADYIAVNVSSPNTPGLRELQNAERLASLLDELQQTNSELSGKAGVSARPLLVKISPDLTTAELEILVDVARSKHVAGIIATNTTVGRTGLKTPPQRVITLGDGGLSGAPLRSRSTQLVAALHRLTRGSMTIIGVGGIFSAEDAWEKICAGASLVQLYTGLVYNGVGVARDINRGLRRLLDSSGFRSLDEAVGSRAEEFGAI